MSTRNHPASVAELDAALGCGNCNASKKIAVAEQVFNLVLTGPLSRSGRPDRLKTAFKTRFDIIARLARNRPPDEFDAWLDSYLNEAISDPHAKIRSSV